MLGMLTVPVVPENSVQTHGSFILSLVVSDAFQKFQWSFSQLVDEPFDRLFTTAPENYVQVEITCFFRIHLRCFLA